MSIYQKICSCFFLYIPLSFLCTKIISSSLYILWNNYILSIYFIWYLSKKFFLLEFFKNKFLVFIFLYKLYINIHINWLKNEILFSIFIHFCLFVFNSVDYQLFMFFILCQYRHLCNVVNISTLQQKTILWAFSGIPFRAV